MINWLKTYCSDERGDMAEKAVVMFLIILAALGAFQILGGNIAQVVQQVASSI